VPARCGARLAPAPVSTLFASFWATTDPRPAEALRVLGRLPKANADALTSKQFFPSLVSGRSTTAW